MDTSRCKPTVVSILPTYWTYSWKYIFVASDAFTYLMLSLILCKALLATFKSSWTIRFKICAQHLTWKSWPSHNKLFYKASCSFKISYILSLAEVLSKVKEKTFLSIPQSFKQSNTVIANSTLECKGSILQKDKILLFSFQFSSTKCVVKQIYLSLV